MVGRLYAVWMTGIIFLSSLTCAFTQTGTQENVRGANSPRVFKSLAEVLEFTTRQSITLQSQGIEMDQAKKAKLAAVLGTIDVSGNLLSGQFTNNTKLGVNLFPAEIFGGEAGTFEEVQLGVQYNTDLTSYAAIKLINPGGWSNLKLAKINIDLTRSSHLLTLKELQENIASNYYNIVNVTEQIASSKQNLVVADTLNQITQNKFWEGLLNQQDVNDSQVNYLNTLETINQLEYLLEQYYISLKILCDIPDTEAISIAQSSTKREEAIQPMVSLNTLALDNLLLQEEYARASNQYAKAAFLPTLSLQLSNSYNLFNTEFRPFSGNWINSNYIGLNLTIPIPSTQTIAQKYDATYEHQLAINATEQARIQASLDQKSLVTEYDKAVSQARSDKKILDLHRDSFTKDQNLFREGLIGLDVVLDSFNTMVNAQYSLISSEVNVHLTLANININNTLR
ncbi:MAG: TolC family protein [Bacteroidota bacterium]